MSGHSSSVVKNLCQQLSDTRTEIWNVVRRLIILSTKIADDCRTLGTFMEKLGDIERQIETLELVPPPATDYSIQQQSSNLTSQTLNESSPRPTLGDESAYDGSASSLCESGVELELDIEEAKTERVEQQQNDESLEGSVSENSRSLNLEKSIVQDGTTCTDTVSVSSDETDVSSDVYLGEETIISGDPRFMERNSLKNRIQLKRARVDSQLSPEQFSPWAKSTLIENVSTEEVKVPGKKYGRIDDQRSLNIQIASEIYFVYDSIKRLEIIRGKVLFIGKELIKIETKGKPRLFVRCMMKNVRVIQEHPN